MKTIILIISILAALSLIGWLGLQIKPKPFLPYPEKTAPLKTIPLPSGLPAPVERFYKTVYGDEIPVIETAVIKGRADISPFGIKFPARFLFVHKAGKDYRHYIEATWFGMPSMKVMWTATVTSSSPSARMTMTQALRRVRSSGCGPSQLGFLPSS